MGVVVRMLLRFYSAFYFSSGRVTRQFYDPWEKSGEALLLLSLIGF